MNDAALVHPTSPEIAAFAGSIRADANSLPQTIARLMDWFDQAVIYSRLDAPYFPLQRSDLDVLALRSGTCGDYSNLIVSLLLYLGIPAQYAWISRDCFGDEQDHICAAAHWSGKKSPGNRFFLVHPHSGAPLYRLHQLLCLYIRMRPFPHDGNSQ